MSRGRKRQPYQDGNGTWIDAWSEIYESDGFEDEVIARLDMERLILALPTKQRIAVQKWMRDEPLTNAEANAFYHAKQSLRNALE